MLKKWILSMYLYNRWGIIFSLIIFWTEDGVNCFMETVSFCQTKHCVSSTGGNILIMNTLSSFGWQSVEFIIFLITDSMNCFMQTVLFYQTKYSVTSTVNQEYYPCIWMLVNWEYYSSACFGTRMVPTNWVGKVKKSQQFFPLFLLNISSFKSFLVAGKISRQ